MTKTKLPFDKWSDKEWADHLCSALDHCLRFSTIPRYFPHQHQAYSELIGNYRKRFNEGIDRR